MRIIGLTITFFVIAIFINEIIKQISNLNFRYALIFLLFIFAISVVSY